MIKQLLPSIALTLVLMVLTGLAYPVAITGVAQALFPRQAHGNSRHRPNLASTKKPLNKLSISPSPMR